MPSPEDLERIGILFNTASGSSKPFFEKCSKTKFLAVKDYYRAEDEYIKLARKTLSAKGLGIDGEGDCYYQLSGVTRSLESGQLDNALIDALEKLRISYVERMLKPAFRQYINNEGANEKALEKMYSNAVKIESLIDVIQFMNKVQEIE